MAKFLNTSATNYFLEELIKDTKDRLILISPFLKLNDRIKELLADKNRLKIDVRIVYGKSELHPDEISWLNELTYVRTSFCKNLHAKCYLNEELCIITSLNLYEFSQVNNNEMGVLFRREEIRISMARVTENSDARVKEDEDDSQGTKLTTSKLAKKLGMNTAQLLAKLTAEGYLESKSGKPFLTAKGKEAGGEFRNSPKFGPYFLWPEGFTL